jgi:hypothetical protein
VAKNEMNVAKSGINVAKSGTVVVIYVGQLYG